MPRSRARAISYCISAPCRESFGYWKNQNKARSAESSTGTLKDNAWSATIGSPLRQRSLKGENAPLTASARTASGIAPGSLESMALVGKYGII